MQAGAAMAVVGWWTGYKLGGVVALTSAEFFQSFGFENYWQITFLILGILIIACTIGLMFINETSQIDRKESQRRTDKMIEDKLGSSNLITKIIAWLTSTVVGPIISFFKKNGFNIALAILAFIFLFKIGEAFLGRMSVILSFLLEFARWFWRCCYVVRVRRSSCHESLMHQCCEEPGLVNSAGNQACLEWKKELISSWLIR